MALLRIYILLSSLLLSLGAVGAPLCSALFRHDFSIDPYADINHQGALDLTLEMDRQWMFKPKWAPQAAESTAQSATTLALSEIRFMQSRVSNNYSDNKFTVIGNARLIRDGLLDPKAMPAIRVWKDQQGKIWTLDHRRLAALILSGKVQSVDVIWAKPNEVSEQSFKMNTVSGGDNLIVTVKGGPAIVVERPRQSENATTFTAKQLEPLLDQMTGIQNKQQALTALQDLAFVTTLPKPNWPELKAPEVKAALHTNLIHNTTVSKTVSSAEVLFSKNFANEDVLPETQNSVLSLAKKIQSGQIPLNQLSLRVWQDSTGRTWTADNGVLAAVRLSGYQGALKAQWISRKDIESQQLFVDSQSGGQSLLLKLESHQIAVVIK